MALPAMRSNEIPRLAASLVFALGAATAGAGSVEWPAYNGSPEGLHYSSLKQINRGNVKNLEVAWTFETGDAFPGSELQCNPLVVNGVLYGTTPKLNVVALEADTGKPIWRFDPLGSRKAMGKMRNRGLTHWTDGAESRIFVAVEHYLYALDAATGQPVAAFGSQGHIDLRENLGREPGRQSVSLTSPGIVFRDLIIVGSTVSEILPSSPGDIRAYDVRTGKLRWAFHTLPHPGEAGYDTWPKGAWQRSGGANNWAGMSLDPKRGIVYVPTGSAAADFYGADRIGENLFANTLLALDAATGERLWHFQGVRHDLWDRDFPAPPVLVTVKRGRRTLDAVAQTTKTGFLYLFDRGNGTPLFPIERRSVPPSSIPGEVAAPTQPFPVRPKPFTRQTLTEEEITQRTPAAREAVLTQFRKLRNGGQFTPGSLEGTVLMPGYDGGAEWGGAAFDPKTGLLYVNANEGAAVVRLFERPTKAATSSRELYLRECAACHGSERQGAPPEFPSLIGVSERFSPYEVGFRLYQGTGRMPSFARLDLEELKALVGYVLSGQDTALDTKNSRQDATERAPYSFGGYTKLLDPDGYPGVKPPWGTLSAINLNTGEYAWTIPLGEYPELAAQGLRNTGSENYGGPVVTAGGLVFIGATSFDKKFRAFDTRNGKLLWETTLPAAGNATPAVYEAKGRQYVVIAAGGGKSKDPSGGSYVAFALPANRH